MKKIFHKIKHLTSKEYEHRQLVILGLVAAIALLAYSFNRYVLNRSVILVNVTYPKVTLTLDGQSVSATQIDSDTYKFVTIPGKHTLTITSGDEINHRQVITARAGFTLELTPALAVAPNPESDELGEVRSISRSPDETQLFYLGRDGTTLVLYDLPTRIRTAISDPVFANKSSLKWAPDHRSVIVQDANRNWYFFDFAKTDFVHSEFHLIGTPAVIDVEFDPQHDRVGVIEYRDNKPVFGIADSGLNDIQVLTVLDNFWPNQITWSPDGHLVALLDRTSAQTNNLVIYDLANDRQLISPVKNVTRAEFAPDSSRLLLESSNGSKTELSVFKLDDNSVTNHGTMTVSGASTWQPDSLHLVALLNTAEADSALVNIDTATGTATPYRNSLAINQPIETFYLSNEADTLYFVSDKILYSFPLSLHQ